MTSDDASTVNVVSSRRDGGWAAAALLSALLVVAAVNGQGLGASPSPIDLWRQVAYVGIAGAAWYLGRSAHAPARSGALGMLLLGVLVVASALVGGPAAGAISLVYGGLSVALPWGVGR